MHQFSSNTNSNNHYGNDQDTFHQFYTNSTRFQLQNYDHQTNQNEFLEFINGAMLGELKGVVSYIQKPYCDINACDRNGWTALMYAANYGHYNVIKALLDHNANSNYKDATNGRTALMLAASNGHTRCIEMLVGQGKADIRIKDFQNYTAAYYATHYGHGSNKIIARLLRIPYNNQFTNYNCLTSSSLQSKQNTSNGHINTSMDSPTSNHYPADRFNLILSGSNHNASFNDENDLHQSSFNSSIDHSFQNERRFSLETQTSQLSNSLLSTNQSLNEILNRNQAKPRPIFKQRQRRLSPASHHLTDANNNNNSSNNNSNIIRDKQSRHSIGAANQLVMPPSNNLRTNSLSLDLNGNALTNRKSISNQYSPDNAFDSWQKNQNLFQYDSVFESPQSSASDQIFNDQNSKLESSFISLNISWNDSNAEDTSLNHRERKPRNSTFVSNCVSNNISNGVSNPASTSNSSSQTTSPTESLSCLESKFACLASDLNEFLKQLGLDELKSLFEEKNVDLHTFLTLSEVDLKQFGITNLEHLATLIAGQLKFKEIISIGSSESMSYVIYLGTQLERTKKELAKVKEENRLYKMGLTDIKGFNEVKENKMQNGYSRF